MDEFPTLAAGRPPAFATDRYKVAIERLVKVIQQLSASRTCDEVAQIVRIAARDLTQADGATFVLRDNNQCWYVEENAIAPLWKGQRFPLQNCISGWVMLNREGVYIEDIYKDTRIPHEAYRPTFVKSLLMVPIRHDHPIGAIGNYWAARHEVTLEETRILQLLADAASLALEKSRLAHEMELAGLAERFPPA